MAERLAGDGGRCPATLTFRTRRPGARTPMHFRCLRLVGHRGWHWEYFMGDTQDVRMTRRDAADPEAHRALGRAIDAYLAARDA